MPDYPRTLAIKLKPLSENSTKVTFAYLIKHPWLQRGDKEVLTREAETLSAPATVRAADKICAVCGTESADDSRFCRKCGSAMTSEENSLEILRMAAETRSGHSSVVTGAVFAILLLLLNLAGLIAVIVGGNANEGVIIFLACGIFLSVFVVLSNAFG